MKKITTEDFVARARVIHGDKYDYSKAVYAGNKEKITIVCSEHGEFLQTPANHTSGFGCIKCGFKNAGQYHKKDSQQFIAEARAIHGDHYDYSQAEYRGARNPITIICPKHGAFQQVAHVHLRHGTGAGCERCSYEARGERARMPFADFVRLASEVHEGAFEYSSAESAYVDASTSVPITCPAHGVFIQTPANHIRGQGCPRCSRNRMADSLRKTTEDFIRDAKSIHGDKCDYSKAVYAGAFVAVAIICPIDGEFTQSPTSHLSGIGCPRCSRRAQGAPRNLTRALRGEFDLPKDSFVYVIHFHLPFSDQEICKIGSGTGSRLKSVEGSIKRIGGKDVQIWHSRFKNPAEAIVFEHLAHDQVMSHQFVVPPEFKFPGHTEVFSKAPDLDAIESHPILLRFRAGERWDPRDEKPLV